MSKIEWTDVTWNPVTGCTKISAGCKNCYAERMAKRLKAMGQKKYRNGFQVTLHPEEQYAPIHWKKSRRVFVCSMSDLFHDDVPYHFINSILACMASCPQHIFQVLTKRPVRMAYTDRLWERNIWSGVTVENNIVRWRIDRLCKVRKYNRFLSCEPLLEPLPDLDLRYIDWVIVGGESGPEARPMHPDWVRNIRDQCIEQNVPFFFKGWGGTNKKKTGRILDGRTWNEMPF